MELKHFAIVLVDFVMIIYTNNKLVKLVLLIKMVN